MHTLNTMTVGMLRMPYSVATAGLSSVFSFNYARRGEGLADVLMKKLITTTSGMQADVCMDPKCWDLANCM